MKAAFSLAKLKPYYNGRGFSRFGVRKNPDDFVRSGHVVVKNDLLAVFLFDRAERKRAVRQFRYFTGISLAMQIGFNFRPEAGLEIFRALVGKTVFVNPQLVLTGCKQVPNHQTEHQERNNDTARNCPRVPRSDVSNDAEHKEKKQRGRREQLFRQTPANAMNAPQFTENFREIRISEAIFFRHRLI